MQHIHTVKTVSFIIHLTLYTLISVCIFSALFSIHFLKIWQGEFVSKSGVSLVNDHFLYSCVTLLSVSHTILMILVRRIWVWIIPMIPWLIFFFILLTYLLDIVLILLGEILSWSLMAVRGLMCDSRVIQKGEIRCLSLLGCNGLIRKKGIHS